jgi:hypothetical protein
MKSKIYTYTNSKFNFGSNQKNEKKIVSNLKKNESNLPEILFITTYPPRECGIATYSQDLIDALNSKFKKPYRIIVAALELENDKHTYSGVVEYVLVTDNQNSYLKLANDINENKAIQMVVIEHEFGLFKNNEIDFIELIESIKKPIILVPNMIEPGNLTLLNVKKML